MTLQVKRTGTDEYGRHIKALFCGPPGAGKTLTSSTWPNVFYANAEGGLMSVADKHVPYADVTTSHDLLQLRQTLSQSPEVRERTLGVPVETVVIDTIDQVARLLIEERLATTKKDAMAIADWGWLGDQLRGLVRGFRNLPMHVVFCCHVRDTEDAETGTVLVKPAIQGAMGDEIAGYVDLAVLLTARPVVRMEDGQSVRRVVRFLQCYPDARHPWVKDRSGKLPMEFPIDFQTDYPRLDAAIYGDVTTAPPAASSSPQPVLVPTNVTRAPEAAETPSSAPEPQPEPQPEPPAPAPAPASTPPPPVPTPAGPRAAPAPAAATATIVEERPPEAVPVDGTENPSVSTLVCENCSGAIENQDVADLSYIRFRKHLCRRCFAETRKK